MYGELRGVEALIQLWRESYCVGGFAALIALTMEPN
jgi:hypothetical protein